MSGEILALLLILLAIWAVGITLSFLSKKVEPIDGLGFILSHEQLELDGTGIMHPELAKLMAFNSVVRYSWLEYADPVEDVKIQQIFLDGYKINSVNTPHYITPTSDIPGAAGHHSPSRYYQ